jgi:hypothetical protein
MIGPIQWLKLYGYAPDLPLEHLNSAALDPREAVKRMQTAFGESALGAVDGWIGRRTAGWMLDRTCLHPDAPDEEFAGVDPQKAARFIFESDSPAIVDVGRAVETMHSRFLAAVLAATGSGSWPSGCHEGLYPHNHCVTYFVDRDSFPDHYKRPVWDAELGQMLTIGTWGMTREQLFGTWAAKPMLDVALWMMRESFRKSGAAHVEVTDRARADIIILSRFIPGSTIGLGWFPNGNCRDVVEFHIDNSYRPNLMALAWLLTHECGHCNRCPHTFAGQDDHRGIMSYRPKFPFEGISTGEAPYGLPRDPTVELLMEFYGSENGQPVPVPLLNPPDPPRSPITLPLDLVYWDDDRDKGMAKLPDGRLALIEVGGGKISAVEL